MQRPLLHLTPLLLLLLPAIFRPSISYGQVDTMRIGLEDAIRRALTVSPEVNAVAAERDFAAARHRLARASRFATEFTMQTAHAAAPGLMNLPPEFDPDALYLNPDVRNDWEDLRPFNRIETQLVQPLYTWGELSGSIRAARHGVEVEDASVRRSRIDVATRTGELYYGLLLTEALSRLTDRAGDVVGYAREEVQRMLDEGADDVHDADLFQVLITEQEVRRRDVEVSQQLLTARSAVRRQLFLPESVVVLPEEAVLAPIPFVLDSLSIYQARALEHRPEIAQAQAGLAAREALVTVARSDYFPKLFLGIESRITYTEGRFRQPNPYVSDPFRGRSLRAGLGLRLPLNFAQTQARVQQAAAQRNEVRYLLEAATQLVLFEVEDAYRNVLIAGTAVDAQGEALTISREWLRTEQINFDLDIGDTDNLIRAVRASLELEATYYDQVRRFNVAVLRLLAATGTLVMQAENGTLVD